MKTIERITSPSNPAVRLAHAVLHTAKRAQKEGLFVAEGLRLAEMAAASGWPIRTAFVTARGLSGERAQLLADRLLAMGTQVCLVPAAVFASLSETETPQGILLLMERRGARAPDGLPGQGTPLYIALDRVQDPGNVGVILRTADAAGASGVILLRGTADIYSAKVVRATMGSLFHVPFAAGIAEETFIRWAAAHALTLYAAACDAQACTHYAADLRRPCVIVLGNEGSGVSASLRAVAQRVYIPMCGGAESLNVSAAAAAILYEAVRQRDYAE